MSNAAKTFDILATILSVLIIMIVQQNYFPGPYPVNFKHFNKTILSKFKILIFYLRLNYLHFSSHQI